MARINRACNTKVGNLHCTIGANENVGRLHIAVHHTIAMRKRQRCGNFTRNVAGLGARELLLGTQNVGKRATLYIFHCHEVGVAHTAPVVHRHNVGVVQVGGSLGLAAEALDEGGVDGKFRKKYFDGNRAVEQNVAGQKDVGHTTAPDALLNFIAIVHHRFVVASHTSLEVTDV